MLNAGEFSEQLVVYYDDAVFSICYLITGPEFPYYKYDANKEIPIAKWWSNAGYDEEDEDSMDLDDLAGLEEMMENEMI